MHTDFLRNYRGDTTSTTTAALDGWFKKQNRAPVDFTRQPLPEGIQELLRQIRERNAK